MSGSLRAQLVIDDDAALDEQPGRPRLVDVGPDAATDDDHVGLEDACRRRSGRRSTRPSPRQLDGRLSPSSTSTPIASSLLLQQRGAGGVELLRHQVRRHLDDGDLDAVAEQAAGRFQAEQAAAEDDGAVAVAGEGADGGAVVEGAEDEDARLSGALQRRHERPRAGGQDEVVVRLDDLAAGADDDALVAVDAARRGRRRGRGRRAPRTSSSGLSQSWLGSAKPPRTPDSRMRL